MVDNPNSGNSTNKDTLINLEQKEADIVQADDTNSSEDPEVLEHKNDPPRYEKFQIDRDGICTSCKKSGNNLPSADIIKCKKCKCDYHALCKSVETGSAICNISLLKLFKQNSTKENFSWQCDSCLTKSEIAKASTLEGQMATLLGIVTELSREVKELKKDSASKIKLVESQNEQRTAEKTECQHEPSYAKAVKKPQDKSTLLIKGNNGTPVNIDTVKEIVIGHKIPVLSTNVSDNGDTYINFPPLENKDEVTSIIKSKVSTENDVVTMKSKLPSISITGIAEKLNKSELVQRIQQQNAKIAELISNGSVFEVIFVKDPSTKYPNYQAVARVSSDIRDAIKCNGNKIYIGLMACRVTDRFYIKRCNTCQGFGHYSNFHDNDTENKTTKVCGYCSEEHLSKDCPKKTNSPSTHKCNNCIKIGKNGSGHSAFYYRCPAYLAEQNRLKSTINYYNGTPNLN